MENKEVARILRETAQLLEIDGAIIGRYRSYEKVAELLYSLHERIEDICKDPKKLRELPGVGENMAEHICEILQTGDYTLAPEASEEISRVLSWSFCVCSHWVRRKFCSCGRLFKFPPSKASRSSPAKANSGTSRASAKRANKTF